MMKGYYPKTLKEALNIINKENVRIVGGGTDFMLGKKDERNLLFIGMIPEIKGVTITKHNLIVGTGVNLTDFMKLSKESFIENIIKSIGSPGVRNWATVGGNLCNASPTADLLPMAYALDGVVRLKSKETEKKVPIEKFILGRKKTILAENEIMVDITLTLPGKNTNYIWTKVSGRESNALSKMSFFVAYAHNNKRITNIRIAIGGLAPVVIRRKELEEKIVKELHAYNSLQNFHDFFTEYQHFFSPIDDQRSTSKYKLITIKKIFLNLMEELIQKQRTLQKKYD